MLIIDDILILLKDGKWHGMNEIMEKSRLSEFKAEMVMNFLAEYDFIRLDKERQRARLTSQTIDFLKEIQLVEKEVNEML